MANTFSLGDAGSIQFGADNEITLSHVADAGLTLKHSATADDKPVILTLATGETDIQANDVIGAINFQAPDEGSGTDAILVCAGIEAVSEGDFSSTSNATKLSFKTGSSETATEHVSLGSDGTLTTKHIISNAYTGTAEGEGIDASDAVSIRVGEFNSEILTTLFVDIGAGSIVSSTTAGDVIGNDGVANAYITRITKAVNGVVYKGEIICLEVPTGGDADINVCANSVGTIAEDAPGEGQHVLANCGIHTLALRTQFIIPSGGIENAYIYLTHGGTTGGTYSAGKFLIRFYGAKDTGL